MSFSLPTAARGFARRAREAAPAWRVLGLLALVVWIAHFYHVGDLGLYEDDYFHVAYALDFRLADLLAQLEHFFTVWTQGRPIGYSLPFIFTFGAWRVGGLSALYGLTFAILTANTSLVYLISRRLGSPFFALCAALVFALYPADTTRTFLTHGIQHQPATTMLLLALLCYQAGRRGSAYGFAFCALITYETVFLVFLAAPLLQRRWDRSMARTLLVHGLVVGILLASIVGLRAGMQESRLAALPPLWEVVRRMGLAVVWGPWVSLTSFVRGPLRTLAGANPEIVVTTLGSLALLSAAAAWVPSDAKAPGVPRPGWRPPASVLQTLVTGLLMMGLAYLLSFTHFPPTNTAGRLSSVHMAAAFGAALVMASLAEASLALVRGRLAGGLVRALVATHLALLVGYGMLIQQDFVRSWQYQRTFWAEALTLMPDMTDGTVILAPWRGLPQTKYIYTQAWSNALVLHQIYDFPASWDQAPRLFSAPNNWKETQRWREANGQWQWYLADAWDNWEDVPQGNVILLGTEDGRLVRRTGTVNVDGHVLWLKPLPAGGVPRVAQMPWPTTTLHGLLLRP